MTVPADIQMLAFPVCVTAILGARVAIVTELGFKHASIGRITIVHGAGIVIGARKVALVFATRERVTPVGGAYVVVIALQCVALMGACAIILTTIIRACVSIVAGAGVPCAPRTSLYLHVGAAQVTVTGI